MDDGHRPRAALEAICDLSETWQGHDDDWPADEWDSGYAAASLGAAELALAALNMRPEDVRARRPRTVHELENRRAARNAQDRAKS
jgi:hypothetical protein